MFSVWEGAMGLDCILKGVFIRWKAVLTINASWTMALKVANTHQTNATGNLQTSQCIMATCMWNRQVTSSCDQLQFGKHKEYKNAMKLLPSCLQSCSWFQMHPCYGERARKDSQTYPDIGCTLETFKRAICNISAKSLHQELGDWCM